MRAKRFSRPRKEQQPTARPVLVRKATSGWALALMAANMGPFEILSDTQGVDFGPYLQRILQDVQEELVSPDSGIRRDEERETRD